MRDFVFDGEIKRRPVSDGLTSRYYSLNTNHAHCLHEWVGGRRSRNCARPHLSFDNVRHKNRECLATLLDRVISVIEPQKP
jgi:hypothetical protein